MNTYSKRINKHHQLLDYQASNELHPKSRRNCHHHKVQFASPGCVPGAGISAHSCAFEPAILRSLLLPE